jgi:hypothetical protein
MLDERTECHYLIKAMLRTDLEGKPATLSLVSKSNYISKIPTFFVMKKSLIESNENYFDTDNISHNLRYDLDEFLIIEQTVSDSMIFTGMFEFKILTQFGVGFLYINDSSERLNLCS